jgi:methyl-accepting chemotaxis protein-3 (ribose and galactose sensor receptor)
MSLKKSSLIILFSLLFFFVASTFTSVGLIIKSNNSLDDVNKEIQVVLSIIDPINHSRTLRVRVMEYVKMVEAGDSADQAEKLSSVKAALKKPIAPLPPLWPHRVCKMKPRWSARIRMPGKTIVIRGWSR